MKELTPQEFRKIAEAWELKLDEKQAEVEFYKSKIKQLTAENERLLLASLIDKPQAHDPD